MKNIFLIILIALVGFSQLMVLRSDAFSNNSNGRVVLWWATSGSSDKQMLEIVQEFQLWLTANHLPDIDVRLDRANRGDEKFFIQAVNGVAADLVDAYGPSALRFDDSGLLAPIEEPWTKTYSHFTNIRSEYFRDGQLIAVPREVNLNILWVNKACFSKLGMAQPPERWDFDTFEKIGIAYDKKANEGLKKRKYFFLDNLGWLYENQRHSIGASDFNETLTAGAFDSPELITLFERIRKWETVDHLIPSRAEAADFTVDTGVGFASFQVFVRGDIALTGPGRWMTQQLRNMNSKIEIGGVELPHGGFPNASGINQMVGIYRGTKHLKEAKLFLQFLTTPGFSQFLVDKPGSLPPNPSMTYESHPDFIQPKGHENEWAYHEAFNKVAKNLMVPKEYSPFLPFSHYSKSVNDSLDAYRTGLISSSEALKQIQSAITLKMKINLERHPELQAKYHEACQRQKKIDELKIKGLKIPLAMIDNPFLRIYYKSIGRAE